MTTAVDPVASKEGGSNISSSSFASFQAFPMQLISFWAGFLFKAFRHMRHPTHPPVARAAFWKSKNRICIEVGGIILSRGRAPTQNTFGTGP